MVNTLQISNKTASATSLADALKKQPVIRYLRSLSMKKRAIISAVGLMGMALAFYACQKEVKQSPPAPEVIVPVIPNTPFKSLKYLYSIAGSKVVSGIHNREPNSTPAVWTNKAFSVTGKVPGAVERRLPVPGG
jgi:hypothetical protein